MPSQNQPHHPSRPTSSTGNPYLAVLRRPGAWQFSAAGAVARLPMSMVGIAIVLMVQGQTGSYAQGGRVSAAYIVTQAICSPQIARLVDRHGQSRVMRPLVVLTSLAMLGFMLAATTRAPEPVLWALAVLIGATVGSVGSLVRARWNHVLDDGRALHTAYSLESAVDELVFVIGPVLATMLATSVHPAAGLLVPMLGAGLGGWWFLAQRGTEPPPRPVVVGARTRTVLADPAMVALVAVFVAVGGVFGGIDVATLAFAEERGHRSAAGLLLAGFALGSLLAGLGYGLRHWRSGAVTRLVVTTALLAGGVALFFTVSTLWALAPVMFVTGFTIAPTLITGNNIVQIVVADHQLTEGLTWLGTAIGVGVSVGTSVVGAVTDAHGAHRGYGVCVGAAAAAFLLSLAFFALVRRRRRTSPGA